MVRETMSSEHGLSSSTLPRDLTAGLVVFLVALPLCLGVALASGVPLLAGIVAGIVGGILVGMISGSQTSVSGPAAGLTAVVAVHVAALGFQAFLLAVVIAGVIQIALGIARTGFISAYFPSAVIKGLLTAIGIILILKQIPHVLGYDSDPEGNWAFQQADNHNTISAFLELVNHIEPGAALIGLLSIVVLVAWGTWKRLKHSALPAPLIVVLLGVTLSLVFRQFGEPWFIGPDHLVQVPVRDSWTGFFRLLELPDFSQWANPAVYKAALTIAAVASLETLLNLEAIDKIDPQQRTSPSSRELVAQGIGNITSGLIGGLPVTSVIVRSSVNINSGNRTKLSAIFHGFLLLVSVVWLPVWLNMIPLSCLAAILLVTGIKLASPALVKQMWLEGPYQFVPFAVTVVAILLTDLLIGVLTGLAVSISFILWSNARRPLRRIVETHLGGTVIRIELANQVSFLHRAALVRELNQVPRGGHVLLDARSTVYVDPDIVDLLRDFKEQTGSARGVEVSLLGFRKKYELEDRIQYIDYSTRELKNALTPEQVLQILKDGHERFRTGRRLTRDLGRQVNATASSPHPLAVVLSCIDSRTPTELIFDLGVGDIFSVRIAGNVTSPAVLGSVEYACAVAHAKLILVIGHTRCGAVNAAVNLAGSDAASVHALGCPHLEVIVQDIQETFDPLADQTTDQISAAAKESFVNSVARHNVSRTVDKLLRQSQSINGLVRDGCIIVVGAMYDVVTGDIEFLQATECQGHQVNDRRKLHTTAPALVSDQR